VRGPWSSLLVIRADRLDPLGYSIAAYAGGDNSRTLALPLTFSNEQFVVRMSDGIVMTIIGVTGQVFLACRRACLNICQRGTVTEENVRIARFLLDGWAGVERGNLLVEVECLSVTAAVPGCAVGFGEVDGGWLCGGRM
jgi:hypothetical protein